MRVEPVAGKQLPPRPPVAPARTTVAGLTRPSVPVRALHHHSNGLHPADPYVRRFWTAVLGPGAVADLLRLVRASHTGRSLRLPTHLSDLVRVGLAGHHGGVVWVKPRIPLVPPHLVRGMPPFLRREHAHWLSSNHQAGRQ